LIARGTAAEILKETGLVTFEGSGADVDRLGAEIAKLPGVASAAPFGTTLHVSGTDRATLDAALKPYQRAPYHWRETKPTLEDAFIHLMGQAEDNYK
jgi:ABC-2 type transport system ATP-binding protein